MDSVNVRTDYTSLYKALYLIAILVNSIWVSMEFGHINENISFYVIAALTLSLNLIAWRAYRRGKLWGAELEEILSGGRILTILFASTVFGASLVAWLSPVGWILWYKLMFNAIPSDLPLYWLGCAILLVAEAFYMYCVVTGSKAAVVANS